MKRSLFRIVAGLLVIVLLGISGVSAVESRASAYISSYSVASTPIGNGQIRYVLDVTAMGMMDEVGALKLTVYNANGTIAKTFHYDDAGYEDMMSYNTFTHGSIVIFQGVAGNTYTATAKYYAANETGSDVKYYQTYGVRAN